MSVPPSRGLNPNWTTKCQIRLRDTCHYETNRGIPTRKLNVNYERGYPYPHLVHRIRTPFVSSPSIVYARSSYRHNPHSSIFHRIGVYLVLAFSPYRLLHRIGSNPHHISTRSNNVRQLSCRISSCHIHTCDSFVTSNIFVSNKNRVRIICRVIT